MADEVKQSSLVKIPVQIALWVVTMIFCAAAIWTTFLARTYVDEQVEKKIKPIEQTLIRIQIDQATIAEWVKNQDRVTKK